MRGPRISIAERRRALRARALNYLGARCHICGYQACMAALDFHHPDSDAKEFTISARMTSWARIVRELDKCVLLCANCHRETHDGMHPNYLDFDAFAAAFDGLDSDEEP